MTSEIHEIGIAVDFGMTGSAVAWNASQNPEEINVIQKWPGEFSAKKVETKVAIDQSGKVLSWGFQCGKDDGNTKEFFKVWLDKAFIPSHNRIWLHQENPQRSNESEQWTYFYIRSLIEYAIIHIGEKINEGVDKANTSLQLHINYIFSTPTTWDVNTIRMFSFIVERAINDAQLIPGVQAYAASLKTLSFNITEPEAVANQLLDKLPQLFDDGDIFLVMDVGGATADPFIAQVAGIHGHYVCSPLRVGTSVPGVSRGCFDIDQKFHLGCVL